MAADRKLNSVSSVKDASFIYAETSSGETVKIAKTDLASVVAGVINPIKIKNGEGIDFNNRQTIDNNTVYTIGNLKSQTSNAPISSGAACAFIRMSSDNYYGYELLIGIDAKLKYGRYTIGANNGDWNNLL
jgi:hypothetical protein